MTDVLVSPVAPADFDAWKILWDGYNAFYDRSGPTALAPELTRTTWDRFFDPYEPVHALVAERDGALLGLAHFLFHRSTIQLAAKSGFVVYRKQFQERFQMRARPPVAGWCSPAVPLPGGQ